MGVYDSKVRKAVNRIAKYGRTVTFVKKSRTPADPNRPWAGGNGSDETVQFKCLFTDPVSEKALGTMFRRGDEENTDNVTRGGQMCFVAAGENPTVDLTQYDRMLDGGYSYTMEEMQVLSPGDTRILYLFRVVK